jgi:hypothetical protein
MTKTVYDPKTIERDHAEVRILVPFQLSLLDCRADDTQ